MSSKIDSFDDAYAELEKLSDGTLDRVMAAVPWQGEQDSGGILPNKKTVDEDGFPIGGFGMDESYSGYAQIQEFCWQKFKRNGFVYTSTMDTLGRMVGNGFMQSSIYAKCNEFMEDVWEDPRNMLVMHFSKYIARSLIQGELFMVLSVHENGFVEVDFISPTQIAGFTDGSGILMAENKPMFPLMYAIKPSASTVETKFIPDINLAYYPELWTQIRKNKDIAMTDILGKDTNKAFRNIGNYTKFIVRWDQGFVTKRNVGGVRATLKWLEKYEQLKDWEIDHKRSSGAYLWTIEVKDRQSFRLWLAMSDEERKKTGIMAPKVPGGTLFLPPGFKLECHNPKLSSISDQDTDILKLISAGLNVPEDVMTGSSSGSTYGGVKMSRGPVTDRIQDHIINLDRWLIHGFWRGVLWLHSQVNGLPWEYSTKVVYKFDSDGKAKLKTKKLQMHKTISITHPVSASVDLESTARALLGVKHGPVSEQLGIPKSAIAKALGFSDYNKARLAYATEEATLPALPLSNQLEQLQSKAGEANNGIVDKNTPVKN